MMAPADETPAAELLALLGELDAALEAGDLEAATAVAVEAHEISDSLE